MSFNFTKILANRAFGTGLKEKVPRYIIKLESLGILMLTYLQGGWDKVLKGLKDTDKGRRAFPTGEMRGKGNSSLLDRKYGCRLDYGEIFKGKDGILYRNLALQPNKNADDQTCKELAAKGDVTLAVLAVAVDEKDRGDMDAEDALVQLAKAVKNYKPNKK